MTDATESTTYVESLSAIEFSQVSDQFARTYQREHDVALNLAGVTDTSWDRINYGPDIARTIVALALRTNPEELEDRIIREGQTAVRDLKAYHRMREKQPRLFQTVANAIFKSMDSEETPLIRTGRRVYGVLANEDHYAATLCRDVLVAASPVFQQLIKVDFGVAVDIPGSDITVRRHQHGQPDAPALQEIA